MNKFTPVLLHQIKPLGWLRQFLLTQRDGLTGHLEAAGYPFNTKGWRDENVPLGDRGGSGWWPYEQYAYWVDGMIRCGILLDDDRLKRKARRQIDHVLKHPDRDGYLGPDALKHLHGLHGSERWPHAVFFRAIIADLDERADKRGMQRLRRHYLSGTARHETTRNICNIEIMAWLFQRTGDRALKNLATAYYRAFQKHEKKSGATIKNMLSPEKSGDHGPTYMELFKLGAVMFSMTGQKRFLRAAENAFRKLERDHVLVDGVPSATEHMRGIYAQAGHETCVITDYLWSLGWLLQTTGKVVYADAMERACFNALPGAVTPDFKALQYFSGPNQVVAGPKTNHHDHGRGSTHTSYRPNPATECCPGNVHRAMPSYIGRMWMRGDDGSIMAALYGPGRLVLEDMTIRQETDYPFRPVVRFIFSPRKKITKTFRFRIPAWCRKTRVFLNSKPYACAARAGSWATIRRSFAAGDTIEVRFDYPVRAERGPEDSVAYVWGPVVFSLPVRERRTREMSDTRSNQQFPAWTMKPASPWNFGIEQGQRADIQYAAMTDQPWDPASAPVHLHVKGRRIPGWRLKQIKKLVVRNREWMKIIKGNIAFTPGMPGMKARKVVAKEPELIQLIPLGATTLRVTWFPLIKRRRAG